MSSDYIARANSAAAREAAEKAARDARAAKNASEERLEGTTSNPFVVLDTRDLESVDVPLESDKLNSRGFFGKLFNVTTTSKEKLADKGEKISLKRTDIGFLSEKTDDFGTPYTVVNLEERCDLDYTEVYIPGTIEENSVRINGGT